MKVNSFVVKAKKVKNNEWVIGYYLFDGRNHFVGTISDKTSTNVPPVQWNEIDPDTICRSTNISDKNDNIVFENDICVLNIKCNPKYRPLLCRVYYCEKKSQWAMIKLKGLKKTSFYNKPFTPTLCSDIEVIDNIFDYKDHGLDINKKLHNTDVLDLFETKDSNEWQPEYICACKKKNTKDLMFCMFVIKLKEFYTFKGTYTEKGKNIIANWICSEFGEKYDTDDAIEIFESIIGKDNTNAMLCIIVDSLSLENATYTINSSELSEEELKVRIERIKEEVGIQK